MSAVLRVRELQCLRLAIAMRLKFEHALASRAVADPIIVRIVADAPFTHHEGHGETLARGYVTGEDADSVVQDIAEQFAPRLAELRAASFSEALEFIDALPTRIGTRVVNAARCAVELALLDLAGRVFERRAADLAAWLELPGFGPPGCLNTARYSGIIVGRGFKLAALLRGQRWLGLRDFKIKVATAGWEDRLQRAARLLARPIARGRATLRADANAGWTLAQARAALPLLARCNVAALEQPLAPDQDARLNELRDARSCDLIADESLITFDDARRLIDAGAVRVFNVRLAKNGGLMPALRIAHAALAAERDVQLGCLVGETSLLSAAGQAFLEMCPAVRFVEGAFGGFLLKDDLTRRPIRFGLGGRVRRRAGSGLGVEVDPARLKHLSSEPATTIRF